MSRRSGAIPTAVLTMAVLTACGDTVGPSTIAFSTQPANSLAGEQISPAVEVTVRDAFGDPVGGTVAVALDPNPCNWRLSGTLVAELVGGVARFGDLSLDKIGRGHALRASIGSLIAVSSPFTIASPITGHPLIHADLICTKPNSQGDGESLAWVSEDDAFWIGDDNRDAIYQVDRRARTTLSAIGRTEFVTALPDAAVCDDGDGDPNTVCSYLSELEQVSFDPVGRMLYVVNTINTSADRPAIFRLRKESCAGCFTIQDWQPLPLGPSYGALGTADGELLVSIGTGIYEYDYETNQVANQALYSTPSPVVGLGYDGSSMWILTQQRRVYEVRWATKTQVAEYDLGPFSIATPRGIETIRDTIYVLEGDIPNPINVFTIR